MKSKKIKELVDSNIYKFFCGHLYFLKYKNKVLFFDKNKLENHICVEDVIDNFMKIICADYISKENIHNNVFWKKDLEQMFQDFEIDPKYLKELEIQNRYTYVTVDLEIGEDYYSFRDVSKLLFEKYFKNIVKIVKV